jgi:KDO2-lipid IV(A) lauroyltransferase
MSWLYAFSDFLHLILFRGFKYRHRVIRNNLRASFPEKTPEQLEALAVRSERYFCDLFLEVFKMARWSPLELSRHVRVEGFDQIREALARKKNMVFVLGHMGNWELYGGYCSYFCPTQLYTVYHPVAMQGLDFWMYWTRRRWRNRLISMRGARVKLARLAGKNPDQASPFAIALIGDQNPRPEAAYWTRFLNQETAYFRGVGRLGREHDLAILYLHVEMPARGRYQVRFEEISFDPRSLSEEEIIERFSRKLEQNIRKQPEIWLWTHRRWKAKRPAQLPLSPLASAE